MELSNFLSVPRTHQTTTAPKNARLGKENVYFCPELNSPISSRHYSTNTESDYSSSQGASDSRVVLGDITESIVDEGFQISSSMISMFYDRVEPEANQRTVNESTLGRSKLGKNEERREKGRYLEENLKNYNSVPTKQSKNLRY